MIPLSLTVRVSRREQIGTSATRRANREEKNMVKENNEVSRCKTAGALLHRDCWRNRDEAVRQRLGCDSRLAAVAHTRAVTTTHRALRKSMLPSPARTKERREQSAKKNRDGPRWPDRPGKAEEKNRSWGSYPKARRKNEDRPLRAKTNAPALGPRCRPASKHQRAAQPHAVQLDESGRKVGKVPCHSELKFDGWMDGSSSIQLKTSRPRFEHMAANCAGKLLHESAFDCTRARH